MKRRTLSLKDKLEILIRQSVCPLCGERLGKLDDVDFDHEQALARGGSDTNDNLRATHRDCHKVKTKTDVKEIAKTKRLTKDHNEFVSKLLSRECGEKRQPTGKLKSRGFPKRKKERQL